jgi:hypothetical protein
VFYIFIPDDGPRGQKHVLRVFNNIILLTVLITFSSSVQIILYLLKLHIWGGGGGKTRKFEVMSEKLQKIWFFLKRQFL